MLFASSNGVLLTAAPQAINVDFDGTFVVQLVLFVALTLALKPLLFDPMLKLFEERERLTDGVKAKARRIDEASAGALAKYEAGMAKARAEGNAERENVRAAGAKREQEILTVVRESTGRSLDEGKRTAHAEADRVRAELEREAGALAREVASRALGREVRS